MFIRKPVVRLCFDCQDKVQGLAVGWIVITRGIFVVKSDFVISKIPNLLHLSTKDKETPAKCSLRTGILCWDSGGKVRIDWKIDRE